MSGIRLRLLSEDGDTMDRVYSDSGELLDDLRRAFSTVDSGGQGDDEALYDEYRRITGVTDDEAGVEAREPIVRVPNAEIAELKAKADRGAAAEAAMAASAERERRERSEQAVYGDEQYAEYASTYLGLAS